MDRMTMNDAMDNVFNQRYAPRGLSDDQKNQMAGMEHEGCDGKYRCDQCLEADEEDV